MMSHILCHIVIVPAFMNHTNIQNVSIWIVLIMFQNYWVLQILHNYGITILYDRPGNFIVVCDNSVLKILVVYHI